MRLVLVGRRGEQVQGHREAVVHRGRGVSREGGEFPTAQACMPGSDVHR